MSDTARTSRPQGRSTQLLRVVESVLLLAMVLLGLARSLSTDAGPPAVVVGVVLLVWYAAGSVLARRSAMTGGLWLAGLSLLCLAAVWVSADFAWVSFAVFVAIANALRPVAAFGCITGLAVGTGGILAVRWPDDGNWVGQVVGPLVGASVAGALVGITRLAAAESAERQRLLDELLATRDELARAHLDAGARGERERLNREIHDTLAQGFTSVLLTARRARHAVHGGDMASADAEIDRVEALGRTGVEDARRLVGRLPPVELDDRSLPAALALLARDDRSNAEPVVEIRVDGESRQLPPGIDVAVLRVAQEAVTNARRHARAGRVVVTLTFQSDAVRLDVVDDGAGFDPNNRSARGYGLSSMRSRMEQLGGTIEVESVPGGGTAVNATVPLLQRAAEVPA